MNSSFSIYSSLEVRHAGRCFIGQRYKFGIANLDFSFLLAECAEQTATSRTSTFDSPDTENEFKPVSNSSRHHLIDDHPDILVDVIQEASGICSTVPESSEVKSVQRSQGTGYNIPTHSTIITTIYKSRIPRGIARDQRFANILFAHGFAYHSENLLYQLAFSVYRGCMMLYTTSL